MNSKFVDFQQTLRQKQKKCISVQWYILRQNFCVCISKNNSKHNWFAGNRGTHINNFRTNLIIDRYIRFKYAEHNSFICVRAVQPRIVFPFHSPPPYILPWISYRNWVNWHPAEMFVSASWRPTQPSRTVYNYLAVGSVATPADVCVHFSTTATCVVCNRYIDWGSGLLVERKQPPLVDHWTLTAKGAFHSHTHMYHNTLTWPVTHQNTSFDTRSLSTD